MKSILVTGGAGFIGSNFVRLARSETDARIVVLDALTYAGNLSNIAEVVDAERVHFIRGDICHRDLLDSVFKEHEIDGVIHFAAESHVDRSILGPEAFLRTNVHGTYTLLEAARASWKGKSETQRFVHVSTDEVYGDLGPEDPPFTEETPYNPSSPYSASKASSDHMARAWHRTYGLPVVVTNCSNNYGPWQFPEKLIPLIILNALEGRELPVYGDGRQVRDWLHVEDHCTAILKVLDGGAPGQTYLIGGSCERENISIVRAICAAVDELLGHEGGTSEALIKHVTDRLGHDRRYAVDASKIQRELGWEPRHNLESSLPDLVRWYAAQSAWTDEIRSGDYLTFYDRQYGSD